MLTYRIISLKAEKKTGSSPFSKDKIRRVLFNADILKCLWSRYVFIEKIHTFAHER